MIGCPLQSLLLQNFCSAIEKEGAIRIRNDFFPLPPLLEHTIDCDWKLVSHVTFRYTQKKCNFWKKIALMISTSKAEYYQYFKGEEKIWKQIEIGFFVVGWQCAENISKKVFS